LAVALAALALAGCGGGGPGGGATVPHRPAPTPGAPAPIARDAANAGRPRITIGALNFPEQTLLGRLYAGALRAAGYRVRVRLDLGSDQAALQALRRGRIDAFPEYLGSALALFRARVPRRRGAAYEAARGAFARVGLTALAPTPFEDSAGFAVRRATARRLGGGDLSDLRGRALRMTLAGPRGCGRRLDCAAGLRRVYGLRFRRVIEVPVARRAAVLRDRRAHVSAVFTTDGALAKGDLVLLRDDREALPPYHVTLVVRDRALAAAGDDLRTAVARLQATLTTAAMQRLNARMDRGAGAARVAARHLRETGLVG
jgi:glycine betaine/choline ABC-type transport system substrate-binding protein